MVVLRSLALALGLATAGEASAHVGLQPATATAGGYEVLRFLVGHGCDGKATTALRIELPPGVSSANPQPKPNWTLAIDRSAGGAVKAITWRGELPADQFDEFLIHARLPDVAGPLAFPAVQTCGTVETRWVETAAPAQGRPAHPAPSVTLTPAAGPEDAHAHHHE